MMVPGMKDECCTFEKRGSKFIVLKRRELLH